jgi:hypothetical protein
MDQTWQMAGRCRNLEQYRVKQARFKWKAEVLDVSVIKTLRSFFLYDHVEGSRGFDSSTKDSRVTVKLTAKNIVHKMKRCLQK